MEAVEAFHKGIARALDADENCSSPRGGGASRRLRRRDTERRGESLITIKDDVVDAHFASLNTIHYLLEVPVFDLQSITDQRACSWIDSAVVASFRARRFRLASSVRDSCLRGDALPCSAMVLLLSIEG